MADFYQTGLVTTLHRLKPNSIERIESDLEKFARTKPIGLVLPALYSEFETPAMTRIVAEFRQVRYLQRIVVALGKATPEQYGRASAFFEDFYTPVTLLWMNGERVQRLLQMLRDRGLSAGDDGKGRSCWLAYGYLLAKRDCDVIALHDCDIVNYDRQLLGTAVLSGDTSAPGIRVLQRVLRPRHRPDARPGDPPVHHPVDPVHARHGAGRVVPEIPRQFSLCIGGRVRHGYQPGKSEPDSRRLGA